MTEELTEQNLEHVIAMLAADKPWTKKECCGFLGITYNTKRLQTLLDKHQEAVAYTSSRRAANRGKKATSGEIAYAIQSYIEGDAIETISKAMYRGSTFIRNILNVHGVAMRPTSHNYFKPELVPEEAVRQEFEIGEIVYSTRYNVNAQVKSSSVSKVHGNVYRVWLLGDEQKFANTAAYDLASLSHLKQLGVKI